MMEPFMDKKEKTDWEEMTSKEKIKADLDWHSADFSNSLRRAHPILFLSASNRPNNHASLHLRMVWAKDFILDKFESFDMNLVDERRGWRPPYPNEIAWHLDAIIEFVSSILSNGHIPKEANMCLQWYSHLQKIQQLIVRAEKHLMKNITKTRFKKIGKANKKLNAQAKLYFGASEWSQYVDEDLLPKTSSSSSVLVNEDLPVDPLVSTTFCDEAVTLANQSNTSARNPAATTRFHENETLFNSPKEPDTLTVREPASNRRPSPPAETTEVRSEQSNVEREASESDKEESDGTLLDIQYDEYEHDEYESYSSGSDYELYD